MITELDKKKQSKKEYLASPSLSLQQIIQEEHISHTLCHFVLFVVY